MNDTYWVIDNVSVLVSKSTHHSICYKKQLFPRQLFQPLQSGVLMLVLLLQYHFICLPNKAHGAKGVNVNMDFLSWHWVHAINLLICWWNMFSQLIGCLLAAHDECVWGLLYYSVVSSFALFSHTIADFFVSFTTFGRVLFQLVKGFNHCLMYLFVIRYVFLERAFKE